MIHNKLSTGMICMLIIIPLLLILSLSFQFSSLLSDNFANSQNFQDECSAEADASCISAQVFSWLGVVATIIPLFMMLLLIFCAFDSELFRKKRKGLKGFFKSTRCQLTFVNIHNSLLILLPLSIIFQLIAFGTEIDTVNSGSSFEVQEGFSLYIVSILLTIGAIFAHPAVNRQN